jgi:hypothetical protein
MHVVEFLMRSSEFYLCDVEILRVRIPNAVRRHTDLLCKTLISVN